VYKCIRKFNNWMNLEGVGQSMMDHYKTQMESLKKLLIEKESIQRRVVRSMNAEYEKAEELSNIGEVIRDCREQLKRLNMSLVKKYKENKKIIFQLVDENGNSVINSTPSSDEGSSGRWRVFFVSSMLWIIDENNNTFFRDLSSSSGRSVFFRIFEEECLFEDFCPLILKESTLTLTGCSILKGFRINFVKYDTPSNDPSHKYIYMYYREQAMGNVDLSPTTYEAFLASLRSNGSG
jgi:hypothetical protein